MPAHLLTEILFIIIAAFIGGFLARSLSLPPILGYLFSGIVFGIVGKNLLHSYDSLLILAEIGVPLLLFTLGFEISYDTIKKINKKIFVVGLIQILITTLALFPIFILFNFDIKISFLFSVLFSFSSTAVVVKILEEKGMLNDFPGSHVFIFLIIQDIFVVPVIFLIPLLFSGNTFGVEQLGGFLLSALKPLAIFVAIFIFSKYFLSKLLNVLYRYPSHELNILATVFIATVSITLFQYVGLPQAIAAFLAGALISEQGKNLAPLSEIRPIRDILLVLFFVLTGMLLDVNFLFNNILTIVAITLVVLVIKFLAIYFAMRNSGYISTPAVFVSSHLSNIGEFAIVIGQLAFLEKLISNPSYYTLLSVFILSLIITPFWIKYTPWVGKVLGRSSLLKKIFGEDQNVFGEITGEKLENHVVICGHGRVGKEIRVLLDFADIPYIVIDFNRKVASDLAAQHKKAIYGDPTDYEILRTANIEKAKALIVTVPDGAAQMKIIKSALSLNPQILILVRTNKEDSKYDLVNLGVNTIVIPELEAGVRIGRETLQLFGMSEDQISSLVKRLRREHFLQ